MNWHIVRKVILDLSERLKQCHKVLWGPSLKDVQEELLMLTTKREIFSYPEKLVDKR